MASPTDVDVDRINLNLLNGEHDDLHLDALIPEIDIQLVTLTMQREWTASLLINLKYILQIPLQLICMRTGVHNNFFDARILK